MCLSHDLPHISRRSFTMLAMAGAGLSVLPLRAWAAGEIGTLAVMCIDYRLVDRSVQFFDKHNATANYDLLALAGASLAGVSLAFPTSIGAFWNHIEIAQQLHHIKRLVVLDHRDCGAYKVAFGNKYEGEGAKELEQHRGVMKQVKAEFDRRKLQLGLEFYLMPIEPGEPIPVVV
jgi:Putative carbonic anhydrase